METPFSPTPPAPQKPTYQKVLLLIAKLTGYGVFLITCIISFTFLMSQLTSSLGFGSLISQDRIEWQPLTLLYIPTLTATLLVTYLFREKIDILPFHTVGLQWKNVASNLGMGALWAIGFLSLTFLILYLLGFVSITDLQFEPVELLGFLLFFLIAALVEEIIFRGYMIPLITKDFHFIWAAIISSLLFAFVHVDNDFFTWIGFLNIFLAGYLLAIVFIKTKELYTPLGLHWIWNFFQGNILGFGVSGHEVDSLFSIEMDGPLWVTGGEFGLEGSVITVVLLLIASVWGTIKYR
jgi:membrane protease YdiL (CAAX protease family)